MEPGIVDGLWVITLLGRVINGSIGGNHVWTGLVKIAKYFFFTKLLNIFLHKASLYQLRLHLSQRLLYSVNFKYQLSFAVMHLVIIRC